MSISCDDIIREALSRYLSEKEVNAFLAFAGVIINQAKKAPTAQAGQAVITLELAQRRLQLLAKKRARLIQTSRRLANVQQTMTHYRDMAWRGVESLQVGTQYNRSGSHFSVGALAVNKEAEYTGKMLVDIKNLSANHLKLFQKGKLDLDIARALWNIEDKSKFSGPEEAWDIAKVIHKYSEQARLDQNRVGASIMKLESYIVRQSHDQAKIWGAGARAWIDFMKDNLDWTRTADGQFDPAVDGQAIEDFLQKTWDALASGIHEKKPGAGQASNPLTQASHTGSLAAKLNKNRVLHFKDADAWFHYNEKYGYGTIRDALMQGYRKAAGNYALMRVFGPSPQAGFEYLKKDIKRQLKKAGDFEQITDFKNMRKDWSRTGK